MEKGRIEDSPFCRMFDIHSNQHIGGVAGMAGRKGGDV
jgi:hypothetical protein